MWVQPRNFRATFTVIWTRQFVVSLREVTRIWLDKEDQFYSPTERGGNFCLVPENLFDCPEVLTSVTFSDDNYDHELAVNSTTLSLNIST